MNSSAPVSQALDIALPDEAATRAFARALAAVVRIGDVIALSGDLGSGKTAFARAFISALPAADGEAGGEEVPSPTFTLVQTYARRPAPVWHFDFYRVTRPEEAFELGLEEALAAGVSLVEWPERVAGLLPARRLDIRLDFAQAPNGRRAVLLGGGDWPARLVGLALPSDNPSGE